jgi:hypothetical protein
MDKINDNNSRVNHPSYYNTDNPNIIGRCTVCNSVTELSLECIDVIRNMPTWKGNAIKYLWRAGLKKEEGLSNIKKEIEDLEKAVWYIQDRIVYLKYKDIINDSEDKKT